MIKRRLFLQGFAAAGARGLGAGTATAARAAGTSLPSALSADGAGGPALAALFRDPPHDARPHCLWFWMNGNVTRESITRDLKAMSRIGLGGAVNFDVGTLIPKGPVVALSPEWLDLKRHALAEADRLGLDFIMHNCPGWSSSGGPWITPEMAMQALTWSETMVEGGRALSVALSRPFAWIGHYRDIATIAFPTPADERPMAAIGADVAVNGAAGAFHPSDKLHVPAVATGGSNLELRLTEARTIHGLDFITTLRDEAGGKASRDITVTWSADGVAFQPLARWTPGSLDGNTARMLLDFAPVRARALRISAGCTRDYTALDLRQSARLADWQAKGNHKAGDIDATLPPAGGPATCRPGDVIDLTVQVDASGTLHWQAPPGRWTVLRLRLGHGANGRRNRSAATRAKGWNATSSAPRPSTFIRPHVRPVAARFRRPGRQRACGAGNRQLRSRPAELVERLRGPLRAQPGLCHHPVPARADRPDRGRCAHHRALLVGYAPRCGRSLCRELLRPLCGARPCRGPARFGRTL